jgi:hypothetical protein
MAGKQTKPETQPTQPPESELPKFTPRKSFGIGAKVTQLRMEPAIWLGKSTFNVLDSEKGTDAQQRHHSFEMELHPLGVLVRWTGKDAGFGTFIVGMTNVTSAKLAEE